MDGEIKASVCFFAHDGKGRYLIAKRAKHLHNEPGVWGPGSGTIEYGEHIGDTLQREVGEEYGATVQEQKFIGYRDWVNEKNKIHWFVFDFLVRIDPAEAKNNEPDKCDEIRWVTLDEMRRMKESFHPQMEAFLEKYTKIFA